MKKIILLTFLLSSTYYLIAQTENTTMNNKGNTGITATTFAALPVLETYVPSEIINSMKTKYGDALYDITTILGTSGQVQYVIRVLTNNGQYKTDYNDLNGNTLSASISSR